jgi:hypothetical protein
MDLPLVYEGHPVRLAGWQASGPPHRIAWSCDLENPLESIGQLEEGDAEYTQGG